MPRKGSTSLSSPRQRGDHRPGSQRGSSAFAAAAAALLLALCAPRPSGGCTVFEFSDSGFAANAVHLMHAEALFGAGNNGTLFVDARRLAYKCSDGGGWHDFFSVGDQLVPWAPAREAMEVAACRRVGFEDLDKLIDDVFPVGWDLIDSMGAKKVWKLQSWVQDRVDPKLRALATYPKPTIGIHVRGGDKEEEDVFKEREPTTPADYLKAVTGTWPEIKGGTCIIVGDDWAKIAETEELARKHLGCLTFRNSLYYRREGHQQYDFNRQSYEQRCAATVDFLTDIELLAHTDYAVLTFNSGLAHLVDTLRYALYGKDRWTFVDASYARHDWWEPIRRYYRAAKQARALPRPMTKRQQDLWQQSTQHKGHGRRLVG